MHEVPNLKTNKLVIGYSLEALEYSKKTRASLLINGELKPHRYEHPEEHRRWNLLSFELGMAGLQPIPSKIEGIRIEEGMANISTEFYRKIRISFDELYIFDLELVEGLNAREEVSEYIAYDWFDVKRGAKQILAKLQGETDFVNEIVFYPSERRDGNSGQIKDCYSKSFISGKDLHKFENSKTSARLAALGLMRKKKVTGPARLIDEKIHYLNVVLEHRRRDLYKNKKQYILNEELPANVYWRNIHS